MTTAAPTVDAQRLRARLAQHPLLSHLDEQGLRVLLERGSLKSFRERRTILREGDPPAEVFFLVDGAVRVFHRSTERKAEVLVKLFRAPALFGEMEVLAGRPFLEYVTTLERSQLLVLPAAVFLWLLRSSPSFAVSVVADLSARLCIATCNERALAFCDLDRRFANLLLDYAGLCGVPDEAKGTRLELKLSQEAFARDLAVSRRAVGMSMKALTRAGLLEKVNGRFVLRDVKRLEERASQNLGLYFQSDKAADLLTHDRMRGPKAGAPSR